MICKKCKRDNAPLKKCCNYCGAFLEGKAINNVTGSIGYRNADGSFTPATSQPSIQLGQANQGRSPDDWKFIKKLIDWRGA